MEPESDNIESWKEAHHHLTLAIATTKHAIIAEKSKRRFLLEQICTNITTDGSLEPTSTWGVIEPSPQSKRSSSSSSKPKNARARTSKSGGGGGGNPTPSKARSGGKKSKKQTKETPSRDISRGSGGGSKKRTLVARADEDSHDNDAFPSLIDETVTSQTVLGSVEPQTLDPQRPMQQPPPPMHMEQQHHPVSGYHIELEQQQYQPYEVDALQRQSMEMEHRQRIPPGMASMGWHGGLGHDSQSMMHPPFHGSIPSDGNSLPQSLLQHQQQHHEAQQQQMSYFQQEQQLIHEQQQQYQQDFRLRSLMSPQQQQQQQSHGMDHRQRVSHCANFGPGGFSGMDSPTDSTAEE